MRLEVNIDAGIAIDLDKVAALKRGNDPRETVVILVSGNHFIIDKPLSETIEIVSKFNRSEKDWLDKKTDDQRPGFATEPQVS